MKRDFIRFELISSPKDQEIEKKLLKNSNATTMPVTHQPVTHHRVCVWVSFYIKFTIKFPMKVK